MHLIDNLERPPQLFVPMYTYTYNLEPFSQILHSFLE